MTVTLINGDCLDVMRGMEAGSVDAIITDPPYGTTAIEWDENIDLILLWERFNEVSSYFIMFSSQPFTTKLIMSNFDNFRHEIIWKKTQKSGFMNANKMPLRAHENIIVFYRKFKTYNPQKYTIDSVRRTRKQRDGRSQHYSVARGGQYTDTGERFPDDVIEFSNWNGALFGDTKNSTKHPTQKPEALMRYLVLTYTNPGDTILDPFMGSGTTGVACVQTDRHFIGIEKDPGYFAIAEKRIKEAQQQPTLWSSQ